MLLDGKIIDFFGRFWVFILFITTSWWSHHPDPAADCYSEAPTDLASSYLIRHIDRRLNPTYWKAEIQEWRDFQNPNFIKFFIRSTFVFKYFKIFYKERIKITLTYGKISKPVSNGSCWSGKSSPVPKWSFLTTSLKTKLGNSFDFASHLPYKNKMWKL